MQLETENQTAKKQQNTDPAASRYEHAQSVLRRLKAVGKKPKHCVKKFNRSKVRVSYAFRGMAPELLKRIENWVTVLETEQINKQKKVA